MTKDAIEVGKALSSRESKSGKRRTLLFAGFARVGEAVSVGTSLTVRGMTTEAVQSENVTNKEFHIFRCLQGIQYFRCRRPGHLGRHVSC